MAAVALSGEHIEQALDKHLDPPPPEPPAGFDPLNASAAALAKYALPRKPDPGNNAACTIWKALVSEPAELARQAVPLASADRDLPERKSYGGAQETSLNWSGAVTYAGGPFTQVFGLWQVPAVAAPSDGDQRSFRCSTWIGLDGHDATSPSMPQVGVTMIVDTADGAATPRYEAWFQWWNRHYSPLYQLKPRIITGFPIAEGDMVACALDVVDPQTVTVTIRNLTPPNVTSFRRTFSGVITVPPPGPPVTIELGPVKGTSAEWIVERPARFKDPDSRFPLPVFDTVMFLPATSSQAFGPARMIRMVEPRAGTPSRLAVLSRARKDYLADGSPVVIAGPGLERAMGG